MAKITLSFLKSFKRKKRFSLLHDQLAVCSSWSTFQNYMTLKNITLSERDICSKYSINLWLAEEVVLGNLLGVERLNHSEILNHLHPNHS